MANVHAQAGGIQNPGRGPLYVVIERIVRILHVLIPLYFICWAFFRGGGLMGCGVTLALITILLIFNRFKKVKKNHVLVVTDIITGEVRKLFTGLNFIYLHWWIEDENNDEDPLTVQSTPKQTSTVTTLDEKTFEIQSMVQFRASMENLSVYYTIDPDNSKVNEYVMAEFQAIESVIVKGMRSTDQDFTPNKIMEKVMDKVRTQDVIVLGASMKLSRSIEMRYGICDPRYVITDFDPNKDLAKIQTEKIRIRELGEQLTKTAEGIMRLDDTFFNTDEFKGRVGALVYEHRNDTPPLDEPTARNLVINQLVEERKISSEAAHNLAAVAGGITEKKIQENRNTTVIEGDGPSALLAFIQSMRPPQPPTK